MKSIKILAPILCLIIGWQILHWVEYSSPKQPPCIACKNSEVPDLAVSKPPSLASFDYMSYSLGNGSKVEEPYRLAFEESLGFFDDIPVGDWELLRAITMRRVNNAYPDQPLKNDNYANAWYQDNWDPDFSCRHDTKVGPGIGDGAKWVCDPLRLLKLSQRRLQLYKAQGKSAKKGCVVYSVGSNGDFRFETGLADLLPDVCEIHTFDFTDYSHLVPPGKNIIFHQWGLKPSYKEEKGTEIELASPDFFELGRLFSKSVGSFKTFEETKKELGHEDIPIDILKIDCEGCEWKTYKDWIYADIRQILVEVHKVPEVAQNFFSDLQQHGYVTYHKEPNIKSGGGICVEYAFLKLSPLFVQEKLTTTGK